MTWVPCIIVILAAIFGVSLVQCRTVGHYAFSMSEVISAGETNLQFRAPLFSKLQGGYNIIVTPFDTRVRTVEVSGYIQSEIDLHKFPFHAKFDDVDSRRDSRLVLAVNVLEPIKNGTVNIHINDYNHGGTYRFVIGRIFP